MDPEDKQLDDAMKERFKRLPKAVQDAITSADVEKHLRELATTHKLHLDQWATLENEVMLALLGFEPVTDLAKNIQSEVGVDTAMATAIAADVSKIVFEPIRGELERLLDHPEAQAVQTTDVETMRNQVLSGGAQTAPATASVQPATPPPPAPTQKVERAAIPVAYAGAPSHERKEIAGDPYREQVE